MGKNTKKTRSKGVSNNDSKKDKKKLEEYKPTPKEVIQGKQVIEHNTKCFAEWRSAASGEVYPCVILDTRICDGPFEYKGECFEYYVNYTSMDRRNDCWLPRAKICFYEELSTTDQIFARNALNANALGVPVDLSMAIKDFGGAIPSGEENRRESSVLPEASPGPDKFDDEETGNKRDEDFAPHPESYEEIDIINMDDDLGAEENEEENDDAMEEDEAEENSEPEEAKEEEKSRYGVRKLGDLMALPAFDAHHDTGDEHDLVHRKKNIEHVRLGMFDLEPWYFSPFPPEYVSPPPATVYYCEFCLSIFKSESELCRHTRKCNVRHPPGNQIYAATVPNSLKGKDQPAQTNLAVFEVDGRVSTVYCQNLCLLSKLFLDHKFVKYDTHDFLFYILTEFDSAGFHIVAYFSKEKACRDVYLNLACILTLPCHQKKGYGTFLISLSYELSKIEKKLGQPEGPISDLGRRSYESYWKHTILSIIKNMGPKSRISIDEIAKLTSIRTQDLRTTLEENGMVRFHQGEWVLDASPSMFKKMQKMSVAVFCDPTKLHWVPFVLVNKREKVYK